MATAPLLIPEPKGRPRRPAVRLAARSAESDVLFAKKIDNCHLVREIDRTRSRQCYSMLAAAAVVFSFIFMFALQHFDCVRCGYQIERLKSERQALTDWNQKLRLQQAVLADPQRIDALARQDLSLAPPEPGQVVHVQKNGIQPDSSSPSMLARNFAALASASRGLPREP
ncbi:MAG: cell division protein FtsL [Terriglobia bacterium]